MSDTSRTMFAEQRHEAVLRELRAHGRVEQAALARTLEVSGETIRKDLAALEARGLLRRVHGGAIRADSLTLEPPVETRTERRDAKVAIAREALQHLPRSGSIVIDAGSTTDVFADLLPGDRDLTVYTNALSIGYSLSDRPNLRICLLGGFLRPQTMALSGADAVAMVRRINVDVAFLGTNAISLERGLTTPDPTEAAVKHAMMRCAGRRVVLADSSKLGRVSQCQHSELDDIDLLITDDEVPADVTDAVAAAGPEVVRVEVSSR